MADFHHKQYWESAVTGHPTHTIDRHVKAQTFILTANADVVKFLRLPIYSKILEVALFHGDFDTGGSAARAKVRLNDGDTQLDILTGIDVSAAGTSRTETLTGDLSSWKGKAFKAEASLELVITTAATTFAAAGSTLSVQVKYVNDLTSAERDAAL